MRIGGGLNALARWSVLKGVVATPSMKRTGDGEGNVANESQRVLAPGGSVPFDEFFAGEYRRVLALAVVLCGRRTVGEELTQEAFVSAYKNWDRIAGYEDPGGWVRRVVANLATSTLRRRALEVRALTRLSSRRASAAEALETDDEFWRAVRELPRRQAQCIALRYLEDRSISEIAVVLAVAESTVRVHLHVARNALAQRLDEELGEGTP